MLRAGPLSDERVIRLINRRFVPIYFDLSDHGVMADRDARRFVVKANRVLGGGGVPTPNLMIMTPAGKVVTEVSNYGSTYQVLKGLMKALRKQPELDQPGPAEKDHKDDLVAADARIDLLDYDGARKILRKAARASKDETVVDQAHYRLGYLARMDRDWQAMEAHFGKIKDEHKMLANDMRMERAYQFWCEEEYEKLRDHLAQFPEGTNRYTEAMYHLGLAWYHLDDKKRAQKIWRGGIKSCSQDPWIYRADWAYTQSKEKGARRGFSSGQKKTSLLKRIGYMGRRNPDLSGPPKKLKLRWKARGKKGKAE